jgi:hypothetical protein
MNKPDPVILLSPDSMVYLKPMGSIFLIVVFVSCLKLQGSLLDLQRAIVHRDIPTISGLALADPRILSRRNSDGKGPAWWALESGANPETVGVLLALGVNFLTKETDLQGRVPLDYLGRPLTSSLVDAWDDAAARSKKLLYKVKEKFVEALQDHVHREEALAEELDSYDE